MDKDLAGRLHPKSYSQLLNVLVEIRYRWNSSRVHTGTSAIISNTDNETEDILGKFAGDKLHGGVDSIQRTGIQRDFKRLELGPCEPYEVQGGQVQGQVGWGCEQAGVMESVPGHCRGFGNR